MSTLKTNNIVGSGNANEITFVNNKITGTASGNITLPGEGGTNTTNLQQGLAKLWLNVADNGTNNDSLNVSTHTDTADGRQTIAITTAFRATTTMSGAACASETDASNGSGNSNRYAFFIRGGNTSQAFLNTGMCNDGSLEDTNISSGIMCGDLA